MQLRAIGCGLFVAAALCAMTAEAGAQAWRQEQYATSVSTGDYHSCMVTSCGDVLCWGYSNYGQAGSRTADDYFAVSAGRYHTCALRDDLTVDCWGSASSGQASAPAGAFVALDAGANHNCAIKKNSQELRCWGANGSGQSTPPGGRYRAVASGSDHSCAITSDGKEIRCWGENRHGQARDVASSALWFPWFEEFVEIDAGNYHTCARTNHGYIYCWGSNAYGQSSMTHPNGLPWGVDEDSNGDEDGVYVTTVRFRKLVTGATSTCVGYFDPNNPNDTSQWDTYCSGYPFSRGGAYTPPTSPAVELDVGAGHGCLIDTSDQLTCWGSDYRDRASPPTLDRYCPLFRRIPE